jgi:AcrR family transcriptional regulator
MKTAKARSARGQGVTKNAAYRWVDENLDRDEQHRLRREALLRTAARAFNETSYYSTSLDELARRLNVTKPTLYYYIRDKDDILFECQHIAFDYIKDALTHAKIDKIPGAEKLHGFLRRFAELMTNDFGICLVRTGLKPLRPESRKKLLAFVTQLEDALRNIIAEGVKDGSLRPCNPKIVAYAIFSGYTGIARWYKPSGTLDIDQIANVFVDLYLHGLAARLPVKKTKTPSATKRTVGRR